MSLGVWLRAGRTQRGLSVQDVARITKIQLRIVERLEMGRLDGLPADVFVRGFIRSYARAVGVSELSPLQKYDRALRERSEAARVESALPVVDPDIAGIIPGPQPILDE